MNQTQSESNPWFVCPQTNPRAKMRLFLFPYAGGGPPVFWKWSSGFPDHIETRIAHYPGRGSRFNETPIKKLPILVERIHQAIFPLLDAPFAFFGHSLGGLIAFELAQSLQKNGLPQPNILFVSACRAPYLPAKNPPIHDLSDPEFVQVLQELNGIPEEIANRPQLMEMFLPALRADFEAGESYQYDSNEHLLSCPIVALGGYNDSLVSPERLERWASLTNSKFKPVYFPGDHFYLYSAKDEITQLITREMMYSHPLDRKLE